jgi:hypothetical protein
MDGYGTVAELGALAGATYVATNAIGIATGWKRNWLGLGVSSVLCAGAAYATADSGTAIEYPLIFADIVLVYLAAVGLARVAGAELAKVSPPAAAAPERGLPPERRFFWDWFSAPPANRGESSPPASD